jgi:hypothetical protein
MREINKRRSVALTFIYKSVDIELQPTDAKDLTIACSRAYL